LDRIILPNRYAYFADSNEIRLMTIYEKLAGINIEIPGVTEPLFK